MAKSKAKLTPEVEEPVVLEEDTDLLPSEIVTPNLEAQVQNVSLVASTEYRLLNGEQVERYYPLFPGETMPCKAFVTINGFAYWFEKGKNIRIPKAVAEVYDRTVSKTLHGSDRMRHLKADREDFIRAFS